VHGPGNEFLQTRASIRLRIIGCRSAELKRLVLTKICMKGFNKLWLGIILIVVFVARTGAAESDDKSVLDSKATVSAPVLAPAISSPGRVSLIEENATFAPHGQDRHYTNGAQLSYTTGQLSDSSLFSAPIRWFSPILFHPSSPETDNRFEWIIFGQSIFTSQNHNLSNPPLNDRPYAGWLYTGFNFIQNTNDRELTSLQLQAGVVGSWALGRQTQNTTHTLLGLSKAHGWGHQLSNQPGAMISWQRRWRLNHELGSGYSWEFIPEIGLTAGNVMSYGEVGGIVRWGRGLKANWGPDLIQPGYTGTPYFSAERAGTSWGYDIYFGVDGRVVANNIFLDGNNFQNSRSVAKEIGVADAMAGAEVFYKDRFRFGFTFIARTPEFLKQHGVDQFGSFNLSFAF
jgi:lipid A 3-O-deacylase